MVFVRSADLVRSGVDGSAPATISESPGTVERAPAFIPGTGDVLCSSVATPAAAAPRAAELWRFSVTRLAAPAAVASLPVTDNGALGIGVSSVSGDGARTVFDFHPKVDAWAGAGLYAMDTERGTPTKFFPGPALGAAVAVEPAWCPAGERLAVSLADHAGTANIWIVTTGGAATARLTNSSGVGQRWSRPAWSPSGEWLTASYDGGAGAFLYKMRFDGSSRTRLTSHAIDGTIGAYHYSDRASCWSQDGSTIIFERSDPQLATSSLYSLHESPSMSESPVLVASGAADPAASRLPVVFKPKLVVSPAVAQYKQKAKGGTTTVTGVLPSGPAGAPLRIYSREAGGSWTARGGAVSGTPRPLTVARNATLYAVYSGSATASACMSDISEVKVRPALVVTFSRLVIPSNREVGIVGHVLPAHDGSAIRLQKKVGHSFKTIMRTHLIKSGSSADYFFIFAPHRSGRFTLRVFLPADSDHVEAVSSAKTVTAR